jgi:hypothetical protein
MKKLLLLHALLVFLSPSCKKHGNLFLNKRFRGVWEYENFSGFPFNNNYLPPGNGRIIVLLTDGTYERRLHDTVLFRSRYFLKEQKDCYPPDEMKIHFSVNDTAGSWDHYIKIDESGRLTLSTPNCYADGGVAYYRRIQ